MKKAIKFAIFYKLRCANGFCLMVMIVEILKKKCIKHIQNNHVFKKNFEFYEFSFSSDDGEITTYYGILKYLGNEEEVIIPNTYKTCEVRYIFEKVFS